MKYASNSIDSSQCAMHKACHPNKPRKTDTHITHTQKLKERDWQRMQLQTTAEERNKAKRAKKKKKNTKKRTTWKYIYIYHFYTKQERTRDSELSCALCPTLICLRFFLFFIIFCYPPQVGSVFCLILLVCCPRDGFTDSTANSREYYRSLVQTNTQNIHCTILTLSASLSFSASCVGWQCRLALFI